MLRKTVVRAGGRHQPAVGHTGKDANPICVEQVVVATSGYASPPCPLQSRLTRRFLFSFFCRSYQNGREPEAQDRQSGPEDEKVRGTRGRAAPASSWPLWKRR